MILYCLNMTWICFVTFLIIVGPIAIIYGYRKEMRRLAKQQAIHQNKEEPVEIADPVKEEVKVPVTEIYRTIKKEPGSYSVVGPDGTEAIVVRVTVPGEGNLWVAALAVKNGKSSERVETKKQAVKLAIELLKKHKDSKNGS